MGGGIYGPGTLIALSDLYGSAIWKLACDGLWLAARLSCFDKFAPPHFLRGPDRSLIWFCGHQSSHKTIFSLRKIHDLCSFWL